MAGREALRLNRLGVVHVLGLLSAEVDLLRTCRVVCEAILQVGLADLRIVTALEGRKVLLFDG